MASQTVLYLNDMLLELQELKDVVTDLAITDATVSVIVVDAAGDEVSGETWPLTMAHVGSPDGTYRATLQSVVAFINDDLYFAQITVVKAGLNGYWELPMTVRTRKFT